MKKALATAGKTAIRFFAHYSNLFVVAAFTAAVVKSIFCGAPQSEAMGFAMFVTIVCMFCVNRTLYWENRALLEDLDRTIDERDHAEHMLKLEELKAQAPISFDELNQLEYGEGSDPLPVQLAWIRYRAEQPQQQTAPDADVQ